MINCIVAVDRNWGIGKNNGLLFNLKADMKFFREKTKNTIVCMGERTLLSFPNSAPLKNRANIVLCPDGHEYAGCICVHSLEQMITTVQVLSKVHDVFIIGGGMFYAAMLPYCDKVFVTKVAAEDADATVFFPNLDLDKSAFVLTTESEELEEDGLRFKFTTYDKIRD